MTTKAEVDNFLEQKAIAVVGVSRENRKFGRKVYQDLKIKGYRVFAVNPNADSIEGDPSYPNLKALPEAVGGAVLIIPPAESEKVLQEAAEAGIKRVWLQPGAESQKAISFCQQNGISVISGECIMMFARGDQFPHNIHRWVNKISGKMPK